MHFYKNVLANAKNVSDNKIVKTKGILYVGPNPLTHWERVTHAYILFSSESKHGHPGNSCACSSHEPRPSNPMAAIASRPPNPPSTVPTSPPSLGQKLSPNNVLHGVETIWTLVIWEKEGTWRWILSYFFIRPGQWCRCIRFSRERSKHRILWGGSHF